MSKIKTVIGFSILISLLFFTVIYFNGGSNDFEYVTETIKKGDLNVYITAMGTLHSKNRMNVGAKIQGNIKDIYADYNQKVKKGEVLATIDERPFRSQFLGSEANLKKAQINLNSSKKKYEVALKLYNSKHISEKDQDDAFLRYEIAQVEYKQALAVYELKRFEMENTKIISPIDGIVVSRDIKEGKSVSPWGAPLFFVVENLDEFKLKTKIDEVDIGKIELEQKVIFTTDAYPEKKFFGTVSQIRKEAITSKNIVNYEVIVKVDNKENMLFPGMTANLSIHIEEKQNVLIIPNRALRFQPPKIFQKQLKNDNLKSQDVAWQLNGNRGVVPKRVVRGITDGRNTELRGEGLKENDEVIIKVYTNRKNLSPLSQLGN